MSSDLHFRCLSMRAGVAFVLTAAVAYGCAVESGHGSGEAVSASVQGFETVVAPLTSDGFRFPLDDPNGYGYGITQGYAEFGTVIAGKYHTGTDVGVPCGKNVYAVSNGTVVLATPEAQSGGWGNALLIRHDLPDGSTVYSQYGHNSSFAVSAGATVTKGQKISSSGTTGFSTGCHLHFEIKKNSTLGPGYTAAHPDGQGYYKPEDFINSHKSLSGGDPGGSCCGQKIDSSGETVLDEQGSCFSKSGTPNYWHEATDKGWAGHMFWTYTTADANPDNYGVWKLSFAKSGQYSVDVYIPGNHATSKKAKYIVKAKGSEHSVVVDQSPHYDKWVNLGTWDFDTSCDQWVRLNDNTGEAYKSTIWLGVDAVKVTAKSVSCGNCDDNNPCTADSCNNGNCEHKDASGGCDDGNACTVDDACQGGGCSGKAKDCSWLNGPCASGQCQGGSCVAVQTAGGCDDGDPCTEGDACQGGACKGAAKPCDDGQACTNDACQGGQCVHVPQPSAEKTCVGAKIWSLDACGGSVALVQDCSNLGGCIAGQCVDGVTGDATGPDDTAGLDSGSVQADAGGDPSIDGGGWFSDLMATADVPGGGIGTADTQGTADGTAIGDLPNLDGFNYAPGGTPAGAASSCSAATGLAGNAANVSSLSVLGAVALGLSLLRRRRRSENLADQPQVPFVS
ncbi:MAG: peptidoglycan DD-metalloendopeptidase family protein [Myxococcota bacterium]